MFSKYEVYTTVQSIYCYKDSDVLKNKLNVSTKTIAYNIKKLKASGTIERIGSDTRGYWKTNSD